MTSQDLLVCAIGIGTVFVGLICLIIMCKIIGLFSGQKSNKQNEQTTVETSASAPALAKPIENRQEIIAAVSAVIAEELGTDISALRILSFKKL